MDLLTADGESIAMSFLCFCNLTPMTCTGWLPSYRCGEHLRLVAARTDISMSISISAILLQIKLAISNLDPKPARLASNWDS